MSDEPQPPKIINHVAVQVKGKIVVFGGSAYFQPDEELRFDEEEDPQYSRTIWWYNLYTERWRKYVIPKQKEVPVQTDSACGVVIRSDIYVFGGELYTTGQPTNALWCLTKSKDTFTWNEINYDLRKTPSSRFYHSGWEYNEKLWVFGGVTEVYLGHLQDDGDFEQNEDDYYNNNQLLCFNPSSRKWTNPQCSGKVPSPRSEHSTAIMGSTVWLCGGGQRPNMRNSSIDLHQLNMRSLKWTKVESSMPEPSWRFMSSLTPVTDTELVLHGGLDDCNDSLKDTWIFDTEMHVWTQYRELKDHTRFGHAGVPGLNGSVLIIGGEVHRVPQRRWACGFSKPMPRYNPIFCVRLKPFTPKSLQHLAIQVIYKHRANLPWDSLPNKLIDLIMF